MTNLQRSKFQDHPFHLVSPSPWPFYISVALFTLTTNGALSMHLFNSSYVLFFICMFLVISTMSL
jgi:cytochrome c oxidase subunit 3